VKALALYEGFREQIHSENEYDSNRAYRNAGTYYEYGRTQVETRSIQGTDDTYCSCNKSCDSGGAEE